MTLAQVKYNYSDTPVEGYIFRSEEDIQKWLTFSQYAALQVSSIALSSDLSIDKFDHLYDSMPPLAKGLAILANTNAQIKGTNPIFELGNATALRIHTARKVLGMGRSIFINPNGGMSPVEGVMTVLSEVAVLDFKHPSNYSIVPNAPVLNLENDGTLEDLAVDYMTQTYGTFSYICYLRQELKAGTFVDRIKEFKKAGGSTVYVYTTGMDVDQMYKYGGICLQAGITEFVFHFNAGKSKGIEEFIKFLSTGANVEYSFL